MVEMYFSPVELRIIARLTGNLMANAFEAGLDPGVLESIYYKTAEWYDFEEN
jgi:hypothetical protein